MMHMLADERLDLLEGSRCVACDGLPYVRLNNLCTVPVECVGKGSFALDVVIILFFYRVYLSMQQGSNRNRVEMAKKAETPKPSFCPPPRTDGSLVLGGLHKL